MTSVAAEITIACSSCDAGRATKETARGETRLPGGWKRVGKHVHCGKCWKDRYIIRAAAVPISGPNEGEWKDLRKAISETWSQVTSLSNWIVTQCYVRDTHRQPGMEKMAKYKHIYLYPEARAAFPDLPADTVCAVEHAVSGAYRKARYELLWLGSRSLPVFRYPTPFRARSKSFGVTMDENKRFHAHVRIAGERWDLKLVGGNEWRRQLGQLRQIVSGEAIQTELSIYRVRVTTGGHRQTIQTRGANGGKISYRQMLKVVAWFPRRAARDATGTFYVRTDSASLLVGLNAKEERLWVLNADHVRRWSAEHARNLNRWADDTKAEQRPVPSFAERRVAAAVKYRRRMNTFCQQAASQLAGYAARRRFATVQYDDSDQGFCHSFPYFQLKTMIQQRLDAEGIELVEKPPAEEK